MSQLGNDRNTPIGNHQHARKPTIFLVDVCSSAAVAVVVVVFMLFPLLLKEKTLVVQNS